MRWVPLLGLLACQGAAPALPANTPPVQRNPSVEPLLVAPLDAGRVAILLEAGDVAETGARLQVYSRSGVYHVGHEIDESVLSSDAKKLLAPAYRVGTCLAQRELLAVVHRIPEDDPTMARDAIENDVTFFSRVYRQAVQGSSRVVIARLEGRCTSLWAVPDGAASPQMLAVTPDKQSWEKLAHDDEIVGLVGKEFRAVGYGVGSAFAWVELDDPNQFGRRACAVVTRAGERIVAVPFCPRAPIAATKSGRGFILWFAHAKVVFDGAALETDFFPTAVYGYEGEGI